MRKEDDARKEDEEDWTRREGRGGRGGRQTLMLPSGAPDDII